VLGLGDNWPNHGVLPAVAQLKGRAFQHDDNVMRENGDDRSRPVHALAVGHSLAKAPRQGFSAELW
jgi:hypothetical protein